uniref:Uncharacterized protein n=1 Tax=Panagrolaimus superbus TaxID=310955 RepID=A0A914YSF1_9BILA
MLKRGINKGLRKEATGEDERSSEDYSQFHNSYFKYALNKKREKRHICIDDVAATTVDHSRVYVHNEWCDEEDGIPSSLEDKNGPDDGSFLYYPNPICPTQEDDEKEDVDILDGVLEQFQGTLELATASSHKLEDKWVEILGLERKDLRPFNNTNISFEQTANNDFDPDKRLVDRLIIQGEDEAMKAEENRIEKIVRTLYSERIRLPGGPGNTHENSLRRQINSSPSVEIYQNEVIFFPFDQSKYITTESIDAQIAISRCYFIKHSNIKDVKSYGIPDKLFEVLQSYSLPNLPLNDNILRMVETLQNFSFIKCLFTDTVSKFDFNGCCQKLKSEVSPFRIARFAEQLLNSVIHQVKSCNLKPEYFDSSVLPLQSTLSRSSINFAPPPSKIPRLNDTLFNGEGYRYFAAREHQKTIRYPNQIINSENYENQISNLVSKVLSSEKGSAVFLKERITQFFSPEAIYTLLTFLRFYADYRGKDISQFPCHKELPESAQKDLTELPLIEGILKERGALRDIPNIPVFHESAAAPMEIDYDFDNDFNYQDSSTDFYDSLSFSPQQLTAKKSQDIFVNSDNTATTATVEIDHPFENNDETNEFDQNFFNDIRQETIDEASNDSLTKIVNQRFGIPVTRRISTRLKRNAKKIEFVYDDSHWETPADKRAQKKKPIIREELENLHDDNLLFAPRETFSNITTSRCQKSASNSSGMLESARIPRSQDTSLPEVISNKFAYRLELGQTIPGNDVWIYFKNFFQ